MSNRSFYIHSLKVKNLRGFKDFSISKLRQVNLIGGLNSSGKSALLEAIFVFCDRKNIGSFVRFAQLRGLMVDFPGQIPEIFYNFNVSKEASIEITTKEGSEKLSYNYRDSLPQIQPVKISPGTTPQQTLQFAGQSGLIITVQAGNLKDEMYATGAGNQINGQIVSNSTPKPPPCFIFTSITRNNHAENVKFYSVAVQNGHKEKLLECLRLIRPDIKNLELLQRFGLSIIHVDIGLKRLLPLADLGDGIYLSLICAAVMVANPNSVLLLDELDGSIHYSKLESLWKFISEIASKFNVQVFATSHSIESISAAVSGFETNDRLNDVSYIRLDRSENGVSAEIYNPDEIREAINREWEIR